MWELDCEESWVPKNWCFWTVVLKKTLESPLDCKEIQTVHPKGDQSWVFIGKTDAEAKTPVLWPPDAKSWLIGKDSDSGRDWGQEEKGTTEDEMAGWHHQLDGHEFGWTLGVGDGQGGLACCSSWGHKESDTTARLNWTEVLQGTGTTDPSGLLPHMAVLLTNSEESLHSLTFTSVGAPHFSPIPATFTMLSVVFLNEILPITQESLLSAQLSLLLLCWNVEGPKGQPLFS